MAPLSRLYEPPAYGAEADSGNYWKTTVSEPSDRPALAASARCDVAVIGAGFTGLSAALHLAEAGRDVLVLEAESPAWGASGRNGGFACLGGAKASDKEIIRRHGAEALHEFRLAQRQAVDLVDEMLERHAIDADRHSDGEVMLAHRPRDVDAIRDEARHLADLYGVRPRFIAGHDLAAEGLVGAGFHAALHVPIGFALNPRKYALGLAAAASAQGARIYERSPVTDIDPSDDGFRLTTPAGQVTARTLVLATNGYSSDNLPAWLGGRYLPVQSNILVTRLLTDVELTQGWNSDLMAYDTRNLLHYFRLLPERRFLFGMRGGIRADAAAQAQMRDRIRADFTAMFPMWRDVETPFFWSGLACLSRDLTPYAGPIRGVDNAYAALAYHGNGVAMASYSGKLLAAQIIGQGPATPAVMRGPLRRFPLGRWRRLILRAAYQYYRLADR